MDEEYTNMRLAAGLGTASRAIADDPKVSRIQKIRVLAGQLLQQATEASESTATGFTSQFTGAHLCIALHNLAQLLKKGTREEQQQGNALCAATKQWLNGGKSPQPPESIRKILTGLIGYADGQQHTPRSQEAPVVNSVAPLPMSRRETLKPQHRQLLRLWPIEEESEEEIAVQEQEEPPTVQVRHRKVSMSDTPTVLVRQIPEEDSTNTVIHYHRAPSSTTLDEVEKKLSPLPVKILEPIKPRRKSAPPKPRPGRTGPKDKVIIKLTMDGPPIDEQISELMRGRKKKSKRKGTG